MYSNRKGAFAVRVHAQVLAASFHDDAVVVVVPEKRAPARVAGAPLEHERMSVLFTVLEAAASSSLHVTLVQVPIGKGVIFLNNFFAKSHPRFAVLGDVIRLGSGVEIEYRGVQHLQVALTDCGCGSFFATSQSVALPPIITSAALDAS